MTPYEKAVVAERLTSLREERGLTREQVASEMGLALSTVAGFVLPGRKKNPPNPLFYGTWEGFLYVLLSTLFFPVSDF